MEKLTNYLNRLKIFIHGWKSETDCNWETQRLCKGKISEMHCLAFDCEHFPYLEEDFFRKLDGQN